MIRQLRQIAPRALVGRARRLASERPRVAIVVSHPIQHFVHLYRALADRDDLELRVFFCSKIGLKPYRDAEMGTTIKWAGNLVDGYPHEFLPESDEISEATFSAVNNPSVWRVLSAYDPDVVVLYGYAQATQLRTIAWCRAHRVPTLMIGDNEELHPRPPLRRALRGLVMPRLLRQYSAFLTVGDNNERFYTSFGVERSRLFRSPFPIDEPAYVATRNARASHRERIRKKFGIDESDLVLLTVGKLSARKRPMDLVEALERVGVMHPRRRVRAMFCGDGPERASLEAAATRGGLALTFAGFVNIDELPSYYASADAFVMMSDHDPHPLVCSEAAAMGLPMILSDRIGAVGPTDIAREGCNALVYPVGNTSKFAEAILRLVNEPTLAATMASASRATYDECDMQHSVDGFVAGVRASLTATRHPC